MQTTNERENQSSLHMHSTPQAPLLEMERNFHVPVNQLFAAFSSTEALRSWWWPAGLFSDHIELDFKVGGEYFINMKGLEDAGGGGMTGHFEEIVENERIVMTDNFADENGVRISAAEAKMPGEWPEVGYITFEFAELDNGTSGFKLFQEGIPAEMHRDCIQGWSESFDKLRDYLERPKR
jgi:uncharacterized protein YndB with AHSA1/START domain